ncbi:MAG: hypothetical protein HYZ75_02070 [Elusimicrobia bacterium]|nr:hypothetical protein [Elusimicrobiota bacterium]
MKPNPLPILLAAYALSLAADARAGWGADGNESITVQDLKSLSKIGGNEEKNWKKIVVLLEETQRNEAALQELRRRRAERDAARGSRSEPASALQELAGSAGPTAPAAVPAVPEAGPLMARSGERFSAEEEELRRNIQAYVNTRVRTPEIRPWVSRYLLTAARHSGGNEVVREHVAYLRQGLASRGGALPTIEIGAMPDANTYGLYTSGIRQIALREGMPWQLFATVLDHELLHSLDDNHDQRNRGGTPISLNWHRDRGDNIFAAREGRGGSRQPGTLQTQPSEGSEPPGSAPEGQDAQQFNAEFAETLAWRNASCAAESSPLISEVVRCM